MFINRFFLTAYFLMIAAFLATEIYIINLESIHYDFAPLTMRDFANYWIAGKAYFNNVILALFDQKTFIALLRGEFGADYPWHAWSYPPSYLFFAVPLYLLPYNLALLVFLLGTMLLFYLATHAYLRHASSSPAVGRAIWSDPLFGILLIAAVVTNIRFAQNGFLTSALFLAALAYWRRHPVAAGIALGLLTVKPQLGILIPLFLVADRNWTAFFSAIATTLFLVLISSLVFGIQSWLDYIAVTLPYQSHVLTDMGAEGIYLTMMLSAYSAARLVGLEGAGPWLVHAATAVPAIFLALWTFLASRNTLRAFAALVLGSFVAPPYLFNYDAPVLSVVCAALAWQQREQWKKLGAVSPSAPSSLLELRFRLLCVIPAVPIFSQMLAIYVFPVTSAVLLLCLTVISPLPEYVGQWRCRRSAS
jgi:arabinofuranan 3-O-arabinosyltransferase